eukprot:scaffold981_cov446-Pavlova_lutheri.AAC.1
MPIPAVFDTDEDQSRFTERSSAVDEAAIEWGYSPLILACNAQLRRWQPTNVSKVNTLLLTVPDDLKWTKNSCETCIQAKQARSAIPKGNEENQANVGELLHMDLMGPITPAGKNGEKYIVSILDEKSKLGVAKPICNKSQAAAVIKTVIRLMEKQTGNAVKFVRSDRGTEFLNAELQYFLQENGIQQQT